MSKRKLSEAQIAANKANGLKSTGQKTAEGKAKVSQNALSHGLSSKGNPLDISTQIPGEQTQFAELLADLTASLQPADPLETQLVARLAQLTLRLNRAATMESAALDRAYAKALDWAVKFPDDFPDPEAPEFETHILAYASSQISRELHLLGQNESRLSRDFARTLTQLRQTQKLRNQSQPLSPTRSLASNGQIANQSAGNSTKQTQPPPPADSNNHLPPPLNFEQTNPPYPSDSTDRQPTHTPPPIQPGTSPTPRSLS